MRVVFALLCFPSTDGCITMSHQSGITASQQLLDTFSGAVQNNDVRIIKLSIKDDSVVVDATAPVKGDWQQGAFRPWPWPARAYRGVLLARH